MAQERPIYLNPLQRDGTNQSQRLLETLRPDYVSVDEREIDDFLIYAREYASLLQYYNSHNTADGDWVEFISKDISTLISIINHTNASKLKATFYGGIEQIKSSTTLSEAKESWLQVLSTLYEMVNAFFKWREGAIEGLRLHSVLAKAFGASLDEQADQLLIHLTKANEENIDLEAADIILPIVLDEWDKMLPIELPVFDGSFSLEIVESLTKSLDNIFKPYYQTLLILQQQADELMKDSLENYSGHHPHIALFLSFLSVLKIAKQHLNRLTEKHLKFYYQEVLKFDFKPEVEDNIHLIFELANNFENQKIDAGTEVLAGKDAIGEDLYYKTESELVVNNAQVADKGLKAVYVDKTFNDFPDRPETPNPDSFSVRNVFAAPCANSEDGLGADLLSEDGKWRTFGTNNPAQTPYAQLGFAIASPMFLLGEGKRIIKLNLRFSNLDNLVEDYGLNRIQSELRNNMHFSLSGEEDWVLTNIISLVANTDVPNSTGPFASNEDEDVDPGVGEISIELELTAEDPPIVGFNSEVFDENFDTHFPVLRCMLDSEGLSALGDLDLSLAAGIGKYDDVVPLTLYLADEFVRVQNPNSTDETIYRANAQSYDVSPTMGTMIWEPFDVNQTIDDYCDDVPDNCTYNLGKLIKYQNNTYQANADEIFGAAPDQNIKIWEKRKEDDADENDAYNPELTYDLEAYVIRDGNIFQARTKVDPIAPPNNNELWERIEIIDGITAGEKDLSGTVLGKLIGYREEKLAPGAGEDPHELNFYRPFLSEVSEDFCPPREHLDQRVWRQLKPYTQTNSSYPLAVPGGVGIHKELSERRTVIDDGDTARVFELYQYGVSNEGRENEGILPPSINFFRFAPDSGNTIWSDLIAQHQGDGSDVDGEFVWSLENSTEIQVYRMVDAAYTPRDLNDPNYAILVSSGTGAIEQTENQLQQDIALGDFVYVSYPDPNNNTNTLYDVVRAEIGLLTGAELPFDGNPNVEIWTELGIGNPGGNGLNDVIGPYNPTHPYVEGRIVRVGENKFAEENPDLSEVDLRIKYPELDDLIEELVFYEAIGEMPSINDKSITQYSRELYHPSPWDQFTVWKAIPSNEIDNWSGDIICEEGSNGYCEGLEVWYPEQPLPGEQGEVFRLLENIEIKDTAPRLGISHPHWEIKTDIDAYDIQKRYVKGALVKFQGSQYIANGGNVGVRPDSPMLLWDFVDLSNIAGFNENTTYTQGELVLGSDNKVYQNRSQQIQGISPTENKPIWEETAIIQTFEPQSAYVAANEPKHENFFSEENKKLGSYVKFEEDGKLYRPVVATAVASPSEDPDLWEEVGITDEYQEFRQYYQNNHVQYQNKVYRALKNVIGIAPDPDATNPLNWEAVNTSYPYEYFRKTKLQKIDLQVCVSGMRNLILENDDGTLVAGKPFNPWGAVPKRGGRFYVGSYEIFQKTLNCVNFHVTWADMPVREAANANEKDVVDFPTHYLNYPPRTEGDEVTGKPVDPGNANTKYYPECIVEDNQHFKASFNLLQNGNWESLEEWESDEDTAEETQEKIIKSLFRTDASDNSEEDETIPKICRPITIEDIEEEIKYEKNIFQITFNDNNLNTFKRDPKLPLFEAFRNGLQRGFIQLQLTQDFLHKKYPDFLTQVALLGDKGEGLVPNAPYTPVMSDFVVDYVASESISFVSKTLGDYKNRVEQFFHITPFGHQEFYPIPNAKSTDEVYVSQLIIPQFPVTFPQDPNLDGDQQIQDKEAHGTLYIGIKDLKPPQNLSILFQVAESSADPDPKKATQQVIWSYLRGNRWINFTTLQILSDDTNGLLRSGIIKFAMPKEMSTEHTVLPEGIHWIKASVAQFPEKVGKLVSVHTQAVKAVFENRGNDPQHLATALPAESVSSLVERKAAISAVTQPYGSFGGQLKEQIQPFYQRISEQLRHKGRGITIFDYERLVLEAFPLLHKVKCINHTSFEFDDKKETTQDFAEHNPGHVKMILVPNLRNKNAVNPFEPNVDLDTIVEVKNFLKKRISNFIKLHVVNPTYEPVQVKVKVKFHEGKDIAFYKNVLNEDIIKFLSPWLYDEGTDLVFGGSLESMSLLNYPDKLSYVDYIGGLGLRSSETGNFILRITTTTSSSVLVAASNHIIETIDKTES